MKSIYIFKAVHSFKKFENFESYCTNLNHIELMYICIITTKTLLFVFMFFLFELSFIVIKMFHGTSIIGFSGVLID